MADRGAAFRFLIKIRIFIKNQNEKVKAADG